jgi:hypothetical protein
MAIGRAATSAVVFARRSNLISRAFVSPKSPCTIAKGPNPAKAYKSCSHRRLCVFATHRSLQKYPAQKNAQDTMTIALSDS